jgi:alpha-L-fucosidase
MMKFGLQGAALLFLTLLKKLHGKGIPTAAQVTWQNHFGAIIHYNMATMIGHQGCNRGNWPQSNDPMSFNPGGPIDTDSWGQAMVAANITYAVYVAKHNCGFTTFPTNATLPDGSPYNYSIQYSSCPDCDVVKSFLQTCKKYNIHPGFYYSIATNTYLNVDGRVVQPGPLLPGQVNVTQDQFYDIALFQLEELWSTYGADGTLFEVWFDGGLPSNDTFGQRIVDLKSKWQPNAAAYNGYPYLQNAVRWIGSEDGSAPYPGMLYTFDNVSTDMSTVVL